MIVDLSGKTAITKGLANAGATGVICGREQERATPR